MDSTINGKEVHIKNPLDLIGLGKHTLEFNIPKADYWDMLKETMIVPTMKPNKIKNLLKGGWVYVDPYNQGSTLWTRDYFTKVDGDVWVGFDGNGGIFDAGTYTGGYYGFVCPSTLDNCDYVIGNKQLDVLKPSTTYTWQWDMRRTSPYVTGDMETFMGAGSTNIIDFSKPVYVNGELYSNPDRIDGWFDWATVIDSQDTTWHRCVMTFTTVSSFPTSRTCRWRARRDSSWKVKNFMLFEGESLMGEDFGLHEQELYDWMFYEGSQGMREVSANFGFYYSEEYAFCSAFKVNTHTGFNTVGFNPVTQEFEVQAEVENFAQIVNPEKVYYSNIKDIPASKDWNNSIIYNPDPDGTDYLQTKAKGCYMSLFRVAKDNWSPVVPKRWQATFFTSVPNSKWLYGGYVFTGNLQTYDIEN